jgi:hypothetical protein
MLEQLHYDTGEARLMLAVLKDAAECIERYRSRRGARSRPEYDAALSWVCTPDRTWPFSFENICLGLDLDPARLRSVLVSSLPTALTESRADTFPPKVSAAPRPALG